MDEIPDTPKSLFYEHKDFIEEIPAISVLTGRIREALFIARDVAIQHRDQLVARGMDTENANHVASGVLYDIQSLLIEKLRES